MSILEIKKQQYLQGRVCLNFQQFLGSLEKQEFTFYRINISNPEVTFKKTNGLGTANFELPDFVVFGFTYNEEADTNKHLVDLVGFDEISNCIQIMKVFYTAATEKESESLTIPYYKIMKKDTNLILDLKNGVGGYIQQSNISISGFSFYEIFVAATVENPLNAFDRDYYVGKFNTKYNLTEWYRQSDVAGVNETVRGLLYDNQTEYLFMAVEVNTNKYMGNSLSALRANNQYTNQTNIAVVAYDRYYGNKRYVNLLGDPVLNDSFRGMGTQANFLYVLLKRDDPPDYAWERKYNIYLAEIFQDTGILNQEVLMGSQGLQDEPLDIQVTRIGLFILAKIGNYFCISTNCGTNNQWEVYNSHSLNIAVIFIKYSNPFQIIDIEARPTNNLKSRMAYTPQRLIMPITLDKSTQNPYKFIFAAQREDNSGLHFGLYDSDSAFSTNTCTDSNCRVCSIQDPSYCIQCKLEVLNNITDYGTCQFASTSGTFTFKDLNNKNWYNQKCHQSCSSCASALNRYKGCDYCTGGSDVVGYGFPAVSPTYICNCYASSNQVRAKSQCQARCNAEEYAILNQICYHECPQNSYPLINFRDSSNPTLRSNNQYTVSYTSGLVFSTDKSQRLFQIDTNSSSLKELPREFTFSFWFIKIDDGKNIQQNFDIINAFGRINCIANYTSGSNHAIKCKLITDNKNNQVTLPNGADIFEMPLNVWVKVSICLEQTYVGAFNYYMALQQNGQASYSHFQILGSFGFLQQPFSPKVLLGCISNPCYNYRFPGSSYKGYGNDRFFDILLYYPMNEETFQVINGVQQTIVSINDYSGFQSTSYFYNPATQNAVDPKFRTISDTLTLYVWNDIAYCHFIPITQKIIMPIVMRGDFLAKYMPNQCQFIEQPAVYVYPFNRGVPIRRNLICWQSAAARDLNFKDITSPYINSFVQVNEFDYFYIISTLSLSDNKSPTSLNLQEQYLGFNFEDLSVLPGDIFRFYSSKGDSEDCFISNVKGYDYRFFNINWKGMPFINEIWLGTNYGVNKITEINSDNKLHICYKSLCESNDGTLARGKHRINLHFQCRIMRLIRMDIISQQVRGKIEIQRLGIDSDGDLIETSEIIWGNYNLTKSPLNQTKGDVKCYPDGTCTLMEGQIFLQQGKIAQDTSKMILKGRNLLFSNNVRSRIINQDTLTTGNYTTFGINVTFAILDNIACSVLKPPSATVVNKDISNDHIIIRDFNLNGCGSGTLIASFYLWRGIKNNKTGLFTNLHVTNKLDMTLGSLGCDDSCLRCNGTTNSSCILCKNPTQKYLNNGSCVDQCPLTSPYYTTFTSYFSATKYTGRQCQEQCPTQYYPATNQTSPNTSIPCLTCFDGCQKCINNRPSQCLVCSPIRYLFNNKCLLSCPDRDLYLGLWEPVVYQYGPNYTDYKCYETEDSITSNLTKNVVVKVVDIGYRKSIPKDKATSLKITVQLFDGNITSVMWKQIDPFTSYNYNIQGFNKSTTKNKFIFDGILTMDNQTGYLQSKYAYQQLRTSSFKYQSDSQTFRILVRVSNHRLEFGYDVIEFYANKPPQANNMIITSSEKYHNYTMKTIFNVTTVNKSAETSSQTWYDSIDDDSNQLSYKIQIYALETYFLIKPYTFQQQSFQVMLPFVSDEPTYAEAFISVYAMDKDSGISFKTDTLNISSNYISQNQHIYLRELYNFVLNKTLHIDTYYQLMVANFFEIAFSEPQIPTYNSIVCLIDINCFNGQCDTNSGQGICDCDPGYYGIMCQLTLEDNHMAKQLTQGIVNSTDIYFQNHTYQDMYRAGDLEYVVMLLKGLLKNYETADLDDVLRMLQHMRNCIYAHSEIVFSFQIEYYDSFYLTMGRIFGKIHLYYAANKLSCEFNEERENKFLETISEIVRITQDCINEFSRVALLRMDKIIASKYQTYSFIGQSSYLEVLLNRTLSQEILNSSRKGEPTYFKMDETNTNNVEIRGPAGFLDGIPDVNDVSDLRIKMIKYIASPYIHKPQINKFIDSPVVVFEIMDANTKKIHVNITHKVQKLGFIQIQIPYTKMKNFDPQYLKCKYLNETSGKFQSDGCGIQIYDPSTCKNCANSITTAVCFCSHLSTFALMFDETLDSLGNHPKLGIYTDFYGMDFWQESLGFIAVIGASVTFFLGLVISIIFDIKPQKQVKYRLMRDFRNIDRYGLKNDNDEQNDEANLNKDQSGASMKGKTSIFPNEEMKDNRMFEGMDDDDFVAQAGTKKKGAIDDSIAVFDVNQYYGDGSSKKKVLTKKSKKGTAAEKNDDDSVIELDNDVSNIHDNSQIGLNHHRRHLAVGLRDAEMEVETPHSRNYEGGSDEEEKDYRQEDQASQSNQNNYQSTDNNQQLFRKVPAAKQKRTKGGTQKDFAKQKLDDLDRIIEERVYKKNEEDQDKPDPKSLELFGVKADSSVKKARVTTRENAINPVNLFEGKKTEKKQRRGLANIVEDEAEMNQDMQDVENMLRGTSATGMRQTAKKKKLKKKVNAVAMNIQENDITPAAQDDVTPSKELASERRLNENLQTLETKKPPEILTQRSKSSKGGTLPHSKTLSPVSQRSPKTTTTKKTNYKDFDDVVGEEEELKQTPDYEATVIPKKGSKQKSTKGKTSESVFDDKKGYKTTMNETDVGNSSQQTRPNSKQLSKKSSDLQKEQSSEYTKFSELTYADDPQKRILRPTDYKTVEDEIQDLVLSKEEQMYTLKNIIKYGNPIANLFTVDSLLFPRHARWSLLMLNIILIWFFCAVIYNNTKSPLQIPDFSKKASSLAFQDAWIALSAPLGNIVLMYLFASLFRITDQRIKIELKKEMALRFIMAYFIVLAVFAAVSWYVINFTATFGQNFNHLFQFQLVGKSVGLGGTVAAQLRSVRSIKQGREEA
ncbi:proprotein convertase subtilisin kexin type partial [Stylonychia lemnae]|uniref:Proprotein convertase subtilisin kexin type partial n=1 Tax=Stylonychia lemnae TaxID=5949 RepID=A0A078ALU8_STYLE|nr:proprotein convertase subtilisin kexin type partial [Stylonychia lemnae]